MKMKFCNKPKKRKDANQHVFGYSAAQYYNDIKHNETIKQTRLERYKKSELFDFDRTLKTSKTVNLEKYKEYSS